MGENISLSHMYKDLLPELYQQLLELYNKEKQPNV